MFQDTFNFSPRDPLFRRIDMASRTLAKRRDGKEKRVRAAPARPAVPPPGADSRGAGGGPGAPHYAQKRLPRADRVRGIGLPKSAPPGSIRSPKHANAGPRDLE